MFSDRPGIGVIAVVRDGDRLVLVKRGKEPNKGSWAFPGGSLEFGELAKDGALRELTEETGLTATAIRWLDPYDGVDPEGRWHFVLLPLLCAKPEGELRAADDAEDAAWFTMDEIETLWTSGGVIDYARAVLSTPPEIDVVGS